MIFKSSDTCQYQILQYFLHWYFPKKRSKNGFSLRSKLPYCYTVRENYSTPYVTYTCLCSPKLFFFIFAIVFIIPLFCQFSAFYFSLSWMYLKVWSSFCVLWSLSVWKYLLFRTNRVLWVQPQYLFFSIFKHTYDSNLVFNFCFTLVSLQIFIWPIRIFLAFS